jgi:hypothetical protein
VKRVAAFAMALLAAEHPARACGVSASGAPAGICDASDILDEKAGAARNRVGLSYGYTSSIIFFSDGTRAPTERHALMASFEHPMRGHWTLEVGAGSLLAGVIGPASFDPGVLADVSLSHLIVQQGPYYSPFVLLSFALAGVWARTTGTTDYWAFDFSASVAAGMSVKVGRHNVTPFIAGRLYGGPVFFQGAVGTDAYKYALGPGLALSFEHSRVGLSFGGSVFGEKSVKGGISVSF